MQHLIFHIELSGNVDTEDADAKLISIASDLEEVLGKHDINVDEVLTHDFEIEELDEEGNFIDPDLLTDEINWWF